MVVLKPVLEGEQTRRCSRCPVIGIVSPVLERSSFYVRSGQGLDRKYVYACRRCAVALSREWQARNADRVLERSRRYYSEQTPEQRARRQEQWSAAKRAELERDEENVRRKRRETQRRSRAKLLADPVRHALALEQRRFARAERAEREGRKLVVAEVAKSALHHRPLPIGPFVGWLQGLVERQRRVGDHDAAYSNTAAHVGVSERRLRGYLDGSQEVVDFAVVDRACSREGSIMVWELYPGEAS